MDRNDGSPEGASPVGSGTNATPGANPASASGSGSGMASTSGDGDGRFADRARELAGSAKDRLADVGATARDRASHLRSNIADALESSADKLRRRASDATGQLGGATGSAAVPLADDEHMGRVAGKVAGGMDATAEWVRDLDVEGMKSGIERQMKEHPGRTLLIAIGLGYLIGKAFRR